jgi:hypothetical protein
MLASGDVGLLATQCADVTAVLTSKTDTRRRVFPSQPPHVTLLHARAFCVASGGSSGDRGAGGGAKNKTLQIEWDLEIKKMNEGAEGIHMCVCVCVCVCVSFSVVVY